MPVIPPIPASILDLGLLVCLGVGAHYASLKWKRCQKLLVWGTLPLAAVAFVATIPMYLFWGHDDLSILDWPLRFGATLFSVGIGGMTADYSDED
ncbi:hypothetical protein F6X40_11035 [Paraburkholderia sp. UCT31]|uniref:hypothetical protein n=1 Tax=Paraburkholderia sp. UCT31 TaxID=2615209 RepID=UPI00165501E1|nr:hypothetical protein [Paraburkholderia sp. UCT31]MBC8737337.1 hypothetical protein [Paraburkholderia sp. UCT31]